MSDTPRTDVIEAALALDGVAGRVPADFARELERELMALKYAIAELAANIRE